MNYRKMAAKADRSKSTPFSPEAPPRHQQLLRRKKSIGETETKSWIVISESGRSHIEEVGKHSIMRRTGLGPRDLRILDPQLSHPSTLLGRKRAIVVNLEHIKAIVTAKEALVLSSNDPQIAAFAHDLQRHLSHRYRSLEQATKSSDITAMGITKRSPQVSASFLSPDDEISESPSPVIGKGISVESPTIIPQMRGLSRATTLDAPNGAVAKVLPFEFRVLEVCLRFACKWLEFEASQLEKEAYPALEKLTSKISTLNLERVRQIKNRLAAISSSVQKVRDQLEHLLDDDMDMVGMYLTDKLVRQQLEDSSSVAELDDGDALDSEDERCEENSKSKAKSSCKSFRGSKPNIIELEMLLEAYFTQIEGTLSKLSTIREYVHDTEGYINVMLDDKQNQMLQMGVMVSTAIMAMQVGMVVVTTLNISLRITIYNKGNQNQFIATSFGLVAGSVILYIMLITWFKKTHLLS